MTDAELLVTSIKYKARLRMMTTAAAATRNTSARQYWLFICSSRRKDAIVLDATIGRHDAKMRAKACGGCVRGGYVDPRFPGEFVFIV